jgi:quinol monooxygenase YgiN
MNDPIVFISRNRVKQGKADEFLKHYQDSIPPIEAGKPGTLVQLAYVSEDASEVVVVRLFPSADALDLQLQGAGERSKRTYEFIEPTSVEIYGTPNPSSIEMMKKISGSGLRVSILPRFIGGFIRPKPA